MNSFAHSAPPLFSVSGWIVMTEGMPGQASECLFCWVGCPGNYNYLITKCKKIRNAW